MAYTNINKPSDYFNTKLYTGDDTSGRSITGINFQPDLVWLKIRNGVDNHTLFDSVRGATRFLSSNTSAIETVNSEYLQSFDSDGFTVGSSGYVNSSTKNYVSWNWLGGGTGVSNTDGTTTSTVSANQTSGFSIVSYTGTGSNATVGHGLNAVPSIVLVKNLSDGTQQWSMYNKNLPLTNILILDSTNASFNPSDNDFQDTAPTSDVFYINGTATRTSTNGENFIAYCFAEKGFSKFGSYTGNGSTDGTFIYTGFKPAFVIHKRTDTAGYSWLIHDNKRPDYNSTNLILHADLGDAEQNVYYMDLLSNGFKHRITSGSTNASGGTYIYMAFAENPLVSSTGVPCTAR